MADATLDKWIDRIENELFLQKELQNETVIMRLSRADLIELRIIINTLINLRGDNK